MFGRVLKRSEVEAVRLPSPRTHRSIVAIIMQFKPLLALSVLACASTVMSASLLGLKTRTPQGKFTMPSYFFPTLPPFGYMVSIADLICITQWHLMT